MAYSNKIHHNDLRILFTSHHFDCFENKRRTIPLSHHGLILAQYCAQDKKKNRKMVKYFNNKFLVEVKTNPHGEFGNTLVPHIYF